MQAKILLAPAEIGDVSMAESCCHMTPHEQRFWCLLLKLVFLFIRTYRWSILRAY